MGPAWGDSNLQEGWESLVGKQSKQVKVCEEVGTIIGLNTFTLGGKMPQIPILIRYSMVLYGSQISSPQI